MMNRHANCVCDRFRWEEQPTPRTSAVKIRASGEKTAVQSACTCNPFLRKRSEPTTAVCLGGGGGRVTGSRLVPGQLQRAAAK
jgi:hypothetical protein